MGRRTGSVALTAFKDCSRAMPRKLDLSDRYARSGQRRNRRRVVSRPTEEVVREPVAPPIGGVAPGTPTGVPTGGVSTGAVAPVARPSGRSRLAPTVSYHYIRADLMRIAVVVGIILVLMAVLFVVLR